MCPVKILGSFLSRRRKPSLFQQYQHKAAAEASEIVVTDRDVTRSFLMAFLLYMATTTIKSVWFSVSLPVSSLYVFIYLSFVAYLSGCLGFLSVHAFTRLSIYPSVLAIYPACPLYLSLCICVVWLFVDCIFFIMSSNPIVSHLISNHLSLSLSLFICVRESEPIRSKPSNLIHL